MGEISPVVPDLPQQAQPKARGFAATISRNIVASLARVLAAALVALVLPAYLTHHLPVSTYGAWVLILQLAAYVSYLDFGIQVGISKFVAEYEARGDEAGASRHASAGLALMLFAAALGVVLTCALAWQVPLLFRTMPARLYHDARLGVLLLGMSMSVGLVCNVYAAVFLGLQRYRIPMGVIVANRFLFAVIVIVVVTFHGTLADMGIAGALVNVCTGLVQIAAWRMKAAHIQVSLRSVGYPVLKNVARYCCLQSISLIAMLCITGLDITLVGHYDYLQTAYYSIATLPTSFALAVIGSMMGPFMPASSALSTKRTAAEMGDLLTMVTRYTTLMLLLTGLPLIVLGFSILRIWVGPSYAFGTIAYLRILVFANVIRNLCAPYATMVSATGRQAPATASAIAEAVVNLGSSIYLARHLGAVGVAIGTVIGAIVGVLLHFAISIHFTQTSLAISRWRFFLSGMLQPMAMAIPSIVLLPFWWSPVPPTFGVGLTMIWAASSALCGWYLGLDSTGRKTVLRLSRNSLHLQSNSA